MVEKKQKIENTGGIDLLNHIKNNPMTPTHNKQEEKSATQILSEHGIDLMKLNDDFNTQLLHAMERYAEQRATPPAPSGEGKESDAVAEENRAIHDKLQEALNRGVKDHYEIERLKGDSVSFAQWLADNYYLDDGNKYGQYDRSNKRVDPVFIPCELADLYQLFKQSPHV